MGIATRVLTRYPLTRTSPPLRRPQERQKMNQKINVAPEAMSQQAFCMAAIALASKQETQRWDVYLGLELLFQVHAESAQQALASAHLMAVKQAAMVVDESSHLSSSALADYPEVVAQHPNAVIEVMRRERAQRDLVASREQAAIGSLVGIFDKIKTASKKDKLELSVTALSEAREILSCIAESSDRENALERCLRGLLDAFDCGGIEGGEKAFEMARSFVESSGSPTYTTWLAGVRSTLESQEVDVRAYRPFYEKGLTPVEAVMSVQLGGSLASH